MVIKLCYVAKLAFNAVNNVAKYEDVVMALKIVAEIGIQKSVIFSDSKLVVNKCQG